MIKNIEGLFIVRKKKKERNIHPKAHDGWGNCPSSDVYPTVFIDAVHFPVRDDGIIRKLATCVMLGSNSERCTVHMVPNTLKCFFNKDFTEFAKGLRTIYTATNEEIAGKQLEAVTKNWLLCLLECDRVKFWA